MAQINPRTFADAVQLADNVYELILTNWGNRGQKQDPNNGSIAYPPLATNPGPGPATGSIPIEGLFLLPQIPSLTAIAIAPRSTVDRCIVHFSTLEQTPPQLLPGPTNTPYATFPCTIDQGFVNKGGQLLTEQTLAVEAPLIGQQLGPILIRADASGYFGDKYTPLGTTTASPFGTAITSSFMVPPYQPWIGPELRLLLYLNGRAALPPNRRAPFHSAFFCRPPFIDDIMQVVPIMGRRRVRVSVRTLTPPGTSVSITGVLSLEQPASNVAPNFTFLDNPEVELAASVALAANGSHIFEIEQPGVPFLIVRANGGFINDFTYVSIDAYD